MIRHLSQNLPAGSDVGVGSQGIVGVLDEGTPKEKPPMWVPIRDRGGGRSLCNQRWTFCDQGKGGAWDSAFITRGTAIEWCGQLEASIDPS